MKQNIEDTIRDNLHKFDAAELPEGYLRNFEKRLKAPRRRFAMISIATTVAAAAMVALVIILSPTAPLPENDIKREMAEVQAYYESQYLKTLSLVETLLEKADPETRATIKAELIAMRIEDANFQNQLSPEACEEQYLAHELQYYKTRQENLEYLQNILSK